MDKEIIKKWLNDIATPTGLTYSGDITICNDTAENIINYISNLEQQIKKQKEAIDKSIELLNKFSFEINVNGQKQYIKLQDLPQGKEVLKLLNGVSDE